MISYAQNFEDVILERFFNKQKIGFYIDIGAADPLIDSVTKHFYDKGWRGVNVEPSPLFFEKLILERKRDTNLNCICSNKEILCTFFDIPNSGLSTVYQNFATSNVTKENQKDYLGNAVTAYEEKLIESRQLSSILEQYATNIEIDFLKIDVEGAEKEVIESNNWNIFRPKVIIVESTLPNSQIAAFESWEGILILSGYVFVYFDGLNRFYLRNDLLKHKEIFAYPPCVFDEFIKYSEVITQIQLEEFKVFQSELLSNHQKLQLANQELQTHHREFQTIHRSFQDQHQALEFQYQTLHLVMLL